MTIPVMKPLLPTAEQLVPFLRRIDAARYYSNGGPLIGEFEEGLARQFQVSVEQIACVSSGTMGMAAALRAAGAPAGDYCLLPAWTFVAGPAAVEAVGLQPYFIDVDPHTWAITPAGVRQELTQIDGDVSAVLVVSPFGAALDSAEWLAFSDETGIAVIFDAAAGFDSVNASAMPTVISLHATKPFGVGEGGLVISTDAEFIEQIRRQRNFGYSAGAETATRGSNLKASEYTAAVGLAMLQQWPTHREKYVERKIIYRDLLSGEASIDLTPGAGAAWITSTFNIRLLTGDADRVSQELALKEIETRRWWRNGCHRHPAYVDCPRTDLSVTEALADAVLGLPFYPDLTEQEQETVVNALRHAVGD